MVVSSGVWNHSETVCVELCWLPAYLVRLHQDLFCTGLCTQCKVNFILSSTSWLRWSWVESVQTSLTLRKAHITVELCKFCYIHICHTWSSLSLFYSHDVSQRNEKQSVSFSLKIPVCYIIVQLAMCLSIYILTVRRWLSLVVSSEDYASWWVDKSIVYMYAPALTLRSHP